MRRASEVLAHMLWLAGMLTILSCSRQTAPLASGALAWNSGPATFSLPAPSSLRHRTASQQSTATQVCVQASEIDNSLPRQHANLNGDLLVFSPSFPATGPGGLAYAMVSFDLSTTNSAEAKFRAVWDTTNPPSGKLWVGLANWDQNRWDWFAVEPGAAVDFGSYQKYQLVNKDTLLAAVVVTGNQEFSLKRVRLGKREIVGAMRITPDKGFAGFNANYDLNGFGLPGATALYDIDYEGDGVYDSIDAVGGPLIMNVQPGHTRPRIHYHDDEGFTATKNLTLDCYTGNWINTTIEGDGLNCDCTDPKLAVIAGVPTLMYLRYDLMFGRTDLRFTQAVDAYASAWNQPVDTEFDCPAIHLSRVQEVAGCPAIAYSDAFDNVSFLRALTPDAAGGWSYLRDPLTSIDYDQTPDMCVIDGKPAVAIIGQTGQIVYRQAEDALGNDWSGSSYLIAGHASGEIQLDVMNGLPVICYRGDTNYYRVVRAPVVDGRSSPWFDQRLEYYTVGGGYLSFGYLAGYPLLAASDVGIAGYVDLMRAPFIDGSGEWTKMELEDPHEDIFRCAYCRYAALENFSGYDGICAFHDENQDSCECCVFNFDGTVRNSSPLTVDAGPQVGTHISLIVNKGQPIVAYEDLANNSVKISYLN